MEAHEIYRLINEKRWTELLKGLEVGEHTITFPSLNDIHSCKAIAYSLNSDKLGREYRFNVAKDSRLVLLTIIQK